MFFYGVGDLCSRFSGVSAPWFSVVTAGGWTRVVLRRAWLVGLFGVVFLAWGLAPWFFGVRLTGGSGEPEFS